MAKFNGMAFMRSRATDKSRTQVKMADGVSFSLHGLPKARTAAALVKLCHGMEEVRPGTPKFFPGESEVDGFAKEKIVLSGFDAGDTIARYFGMESNAPVAEPEAA